jgi:hypothetical protein
MSSPKRTRAESDAESDTESDLEATGHVPVSWTYIDSEEGHWIMYARVSKALLDALPTVKPTYIAAINKRDLSPFRERGLKCLDKIVAQLRYVLAPVNSNNTPPPESVTHPLHRLLALAIYAQYGGYPYEDRETLHYMYQGCRQCPRLSERDDCEHFTRQLWMSVPRDLISWADFSQRQVEVDDQKQTEDVIDGVQNAVHLGTVVLCDLC